MEEVENCETPWEASQMEPHQLTEFWGATSLYNMLAYEGSLLIRDKHA